MLREISIGIALLVGTLVALCPPAHSQPELETGALHAQVTGASYHVIFTGTFYEPREAPVETRRPYTFEVIVDGEKNWIFVIDKVVSLSKVATELGILKGIFPPRLSFRGKKKALHYLQEPQIAGKRLIVQGHLYKKQRRLQVTRVEAAEDGG
jgi:hypothetical protein